MSGSDVEGSVKIRTFHPRRGRFDDEKRANFARLVGIYGVPETGPLDLVDIGGGAPVVMEIGSGMGEATFAMAQAEPDILILAVDIHSPGILRLLRSVESAGLTNVRVAHTDAIEVLTHQVPLQSLAGVRIFFPDPWPKLRHRKRRIVQGPTIALITSRLSVGATLHLATDVPDYAEQMLAVVEAEPLLHNDYSGSFGSTGFAPRPPERPFTKFEVSGLDRDHPVADIVVRRI